MCVQGKLDRKLTQEATTNQYRFRLHNNEKINVLHAQIKAYCFFYKYMYHGKQKSNNTHCFLYYCYPSIEGEMQIKTINELKVFKTSCKGLKIATSLHLQKSIFIQVSFEFQIFHNSSSFIIAYTRTCTCDKSQVHFEYFLLILHNNYQQIILREIGSE